MVNSSSFKMGLSNKCLRLLNIICYGANLFTNILAPRKRPLTVKFCNYFYRWCVHRSQSPIIHDFCFQVVRNVVFPDHPEMGVWSNHPDFYTNLTKKWVTNANRPLCFSALIGELVKRMARGQAPYLNVVSSIIKIKNRNTVGLPAYIHSHGYKRLEPPRYYPTIKSQFSEDFCTRQIKFKIFLE